MSKPLYKTYFSGGPLNGQVRRAPHIPRLVVASDEDTRTVYTLWAKRMKGADPVFLFREGKSSPEEEEFEAAISALAMPKPESWTAGSSAFEIIGTDAYGNTYVLPSAFKQKPHYKSSSSMLDAYLPDDDDTDEEYSDFLQLLSKESLAKGKVEDEPTYSGKPKKIPRKRKRRPPIREEEEEPKVKKFGAPPIRRIKRRVSDEEQ